MWRQMDPETRAKIIVGVLTALTAMFGCIAAYAPVFGHH
jgi:hypothetical protein